MIAVPIAVATLAPSELPAKVRRVTAQELLRDGGDLTAASLRHWLLDQGLAVEGDGLLYVTPRGREVAGAITFLG